MPHDEGHDVDEATKIKRFGNAESVPDEAETTRLCQIWFNPGVSLVGLNIAIELILGPPFQGGISFGPHVGVQNVTF